MNYMNSELIPSKTKMMNWITEIFNQGIRRPGYPANRWAENWVKEWFEIFGLKEIKQDPVPFKKWETEIGKLEIWPVNEPERVMELPCFPLPYSASAGGIEAELCMIADEENLPGKIAVHELELVNLPAFVLKSLSDNYYDPRNEFDNLSQLMPFSFSVQEVVEPAVESRALAFIGILSNYPWETHDYYVPYDAKERKLSGAWVSPANGRKILELMKGGTVKGRLSYHGQITDAVSHNITGILPGKSEEWVIIGTHHDGPWSSAVEDASGMALVLAQAEYWSLVPEDKRPFNLMFLMNCAHMAGGEGTWAFARRNREFLKKVVFAIHLEHVARDVKSENGKLIALETPTVRWWFTSRIFHLKGVVKDAFVEEKLIRSVIMPPDGFPPGIEWPPTDGAPYHVMGVPFISLLAAPPYLFDSGDTPDKVHEESLEPITRAVIRIINGMRNQTARGLRKQIKGKDEI